MRTAISGTRTGPVLGNGARARWGMYGRWSGCPTMIVGGTLVESIGIAFSTDGQHSR